MPTKTQPLGGSPPVSGPIPVKCGDFRCLAYRDKQGAWRNWVTRRELTGNVQPSEAN